MMVVQVVQASYLKQEIKRRENFELEFQFLFFSFLFFSFIELHELLAPATSSRTNRGGGKEFIIKRKQRKISNEKK